MTNSIDSALSFENEQVCVDVFWNVFPPLQSATSGNPASGKSSLLGPLYSAWFHFGSLWFTLFPILFYQLEAVATSQLFDELFIFDRTMRDVTTLLACLLVLLLLSHSFCCYILFGLIDLISLDFFVSGGRGTALKIAMNKTRTNCFILFRNDKEELLLFSGKRSKRD